MENSQVSDNKITAAGILLVSNDGKVLAFARRGDKTKLGLPAGKREEGEDLKTTAIRELFEETGFITEIEEDDNEIFVYKPDDMQQESIDEYCATFIKRLDQDSSTFVIQESNKDSEGNLEGFGLWVTPEEFIKAGSSAFLDYNTNLLKFAKLIN